MESRDEEILKLQLYVNSVEKDMTMLLQTLQWDRKLLLKVPEMVSCKHDPNHRVLKSNVEAHEEKCLLRKEGYTEPFKLLPDPLYNDGNTLVKYSSSDIQRIIIEASKNDSQFKRGGAECSDLEPLTLDRLQSTYTADERRAIHDAVVEAVPSCHDLTDLALPSTSEGGEGKKVKSRLEVLAELRDMKRRRAKYRGAAKTRNYSDVLRDVIKSQMEYYDAKNSTTPQTEHVDYEKVKADHSRDRIQKEWNKKDVPNDKRKYDPDKKKRREYFGSDTDYSNKEGRDKKYKEERTSVKEYQDKYSFKEKRHKDDRRSKYDEYSHKTSSRSRDKTSMESVREVKRQKSDCKYSSYDDGKRSRKNRSRSPSKHKYQRSDF